MRTLLPFLTIFLTTHLFAATYYVDYSHGVDTQAGTSDTSPWKHAPGDPMAADLSLAAKLAPGDIVLFKGGVIYRGSIEIPASGKDASAITYKGDGWGDAKAIIDGSAPIDTKWTQCTSADELRGNKNYEKIYYTTAPKGYGFREGTYENADFIAPSQDPTPADPFNYDRTDQLRVLPFKKPGFAQTDDSITDSQYFTQSDPNFYAGTSVIVWHRPNVMSICKITSFDPVTHTIHHEKVGGGGIYGDRDTYYAIMNHPAYLSAPGQYCFDEKTNRLYVWPRHNPDPKDNEYSIAGTGTGIAASKKHHLLITGFIVQKFVYGITVGDPGTTDVEIRNNEIRSLKSNDKYAISVSGTNIKVIDNRVTDCVRAVGILANGKDVLVKGNFIQRASRQGIWFMGAEHCEIIGNTVADCSGTHANGISIYLFSKDMLVAGNTVLRTGSAFTYHGNGDKTPKAESLFVYNNVFDGAVNSWGNNMYDVTLINNTFLGPANVGSDLGKQVFINNIANGGGNGTVRSNNIFTALNWAQNPEHKWILAPTEIDWSAKNRADLFVDLAKGDYHLKADSPALGAGIDPTAYLPIALFPDYDFSKDIEGHPRSINGKWPIGAFGPVNPQK